MDSIDRNEVVQYLSLLVESSPFNWKILKLKKLVGRLWKFKPDFSETYYL